MTRPRLVLITGEPGSGKSTLGRRLGSELRLPFVARDDVRGGLAFTAGVWGDADDFGGMPSSDDAVEAFLSTLESMLSHGVSCVAEYVVRANRPRDLERLRAVGDLVVVRTACAGALDRMVERHRSERLVGLPNTLAAAGVASADQHAALAADRMRVVVDEMLTDFPVPILDVDTDDGFAPDVETIIAFVTSDAVDGR